MKTKRILMSLSGVMLCAVSVGIFKTAALGVDPFQSLMSGLDQLIPIPFGALYVIVNLILLSFSLIVDRSKIGLATFINLFLLGYVADFAHASFSAALPDPSMLVRCVCLLLGVVLSCLSASLYMTADLGVSTYDAIAIAMGGKWHIAPFQYCRIATDLVCVVSGIALFLLGGGAISAIPTIAGVGTVITAFFMGPLIERFNAYVSRPLLRGK